MSVQGSWVGLGEEECSGGGWLKASWDAESSEGKREGKLVGNHCKKRDITKQHDEKTIIKIAQTRRGKFI